MIEPNLPGLSAGQQCALLSISRSSFYYEPKGETEMNLDLMRVIHCPAVEMQFRREGISSSWRRLSTACDSLSGHCLRQYPDGQWMTWHLRSSRVRGWPQWGHVSPQNDHVVNEKRIRRLMRLMGLMPIYQRPNTSKAAKGHRIYPYLLRGLRVDRLNQVLLSCM